VYYILLAVMGLTHSSCVVRVCTCDILCPEFSHILVTVMCMQRSMFCMYTHLGMPYMLSSIY